MNEKNKGKYLIIIGLTLFTVCIAFGLLGETKTITYEFTGNENSGLSGFMLYDNCVELRNIETNETTYYPSDILPAELDKGDIIKIEIKYSLLNPEGSLQVLKDPSEIL